LQTEPTHILPLSRPVRRTIAARAQISKHQQAIVTSFATPNKRSIDEDGLPCAAAGRANRRAD
jgi:hypothetical protein